MRTPVCSRWCPSLDHHLPDTALYAFVEYLGDEGLGSTMLASCKAMVSFDASLWKRAAYHSWLAQRTAEIEELQAQFEQEWNRSPEYDSDNSTQRYGRDYGYDGGSDWCGGVRPKFDEYYSTPSECYDSD